MKQSGVTSLILAVAVLLIAVNQLISIRLLRKQHRPAIFDNDISWFPEEPIQIINKGTDDGIEIVIQADSGEGLKIVECDKCQSPDDGSLRTCIGHEDE